MGRGLSDKKTPGWNFDNSYARLPSILFSPTKAVPVGGPGLVMFNSALAESLGLNSQALKEQDGLAVFSGNCAPPGAAPIAQAYAGHQFGHFTMLGDGRAVLLGEQMAPTGERFDIQLKGSGRTPFSRGGDGRAALGPMLREYIISEAMHALGIPTTRSLAVVSTGETVSRQVPLSGAILTRVAQSHIRVGTFEYIDARNDRETLEVLASYTLTRHFPDLVSDNSPHLALLHAVMERQASLIAKWQMVGFIHGVMNTDNMAICGETIDYGPCAFMDIYDPKTVFSSIDRNGRYAYGNQPKIAQWNLARFAESLVPLLHTNHDEAVELAQNAVESFPAMMNRHLLAGMRAKLGIFTEESDDAALIETLLNWMYESRVDYTNTFRALSTIEGHSDGLTQDDAFRAWHESWQSRLKRQPQSREAASNLMRLHNPAVIPRNHRVEEALGAAVERADYSVMQQLLEAIKMPYEDSPLHLNYRAPSATGDEPYQTFCGT